MSKVYTHSGYEQNMITADKRLQELMPDDLWVKLEDHKADMKAEYERGLADGQKSMAVTER